MLQFYCPECVAPINMIVAFLMGHLLIITTRYKSTCGSKPKGKGAVFLYFLNLQYL